MSGFISWLSRIWLDTPRAPTPMQEPPAELTNDERIAELAALIERGDTSEEGMKRIADLLG